MHWFYVLDTIHQIIQSQKYNYFSKQKKENETKWREDCILLLIQTNSNENHRFYSKNKGKEVSHVQANGGSLHYGTPHYQTGPMIILAFRDN